MWKYVKVCCRELPGLGAISYRFRVVQNADFTRMSAPQNQAGVTGKVVALHFPEHPEDSENNHCMSSD